MKKLIILSFIMISMIFSLKLQGKSIDKQTAENVAQNFIYEKALSRNMHNDFQIFASALEGKIWIIRLAPEGFVMVSGSDRVFPIIGFSFKGDYNENINIPSPVEAMISIFSKQILLAENNNIEASAKDAALWIHYTAIPFIPEQSKEKFIDPLLVSNWDQGAWYNELCPVDNMGPGGHAYAGCVATSMAQVMYYYRFPQTGQGQRSYYSSYGSLSANFGASTYEYDKMITSLNTSNYEMAELQYHCGVSVSMYYSAGGSSAQISTAAGSMKQYFRYSTATHYERWYYGGNWKSMIRSNLDTRKPIIYAGFPQSGAGHAFVLDGYQGTDHFHFNWGWSGYYDGYFYLDDLTPGNNDFSYGQEAVVNILPGGSYPSYCASSQTLTGQVGSFTDGSGHQDYQNNTNCQWLISPPGIEKIQLDFKEFRTEYNNDFVTVYDGNSSSDPVLGTFSAGSLPSTLYSTGDEMLVTFSSNSSGTDNGWFAEYKCTLPVYCSGVTTLISSSGSFSDGSGSNQYSPNSNCKWLINPPNAGFINVTFTAFDTESNYDIVSLIDPTTTPATTLAEFSGNSIPPSYTHWGSQVLVIFKTNGSNNSQGWEANYLSYEVGVDENELSKINIYPLPADEILHIDRESFTKAWTIRLFDQQGKQLLLKEAISVNKADISVRSLAPGLYFIEISEEGKSIRKKVIIL